MTFPFIYPYNPADKRRKHYYNKMKQGVKRDPSAIYNKGYEGNQYKGDSPNNCPRKPAAVCLLARRKKRGGKATERHRKCSENRRVFKSRTRKIHNKCKKHNKC